VTLESAKQNGTATLVHCDAGISRSSTVVISFVMKEKQLRLQKAYEYVRKKRGIIQPNFGFIRQLISYEKELFLLEKEDEAFLADYLKIVFHFKEFDVPTEVILKCLERANYEVWLAFKYVLDETAPKKKK
jgi:hypothetical protein